MTDPFSRSEAMANVRRWTIRVLIFLLVVPALGFVLWTWAALKFTYATGERSGFVQKISKKGWVCKTWEGELAMANLPGTMPQLFPFTVRDEKVVKDIERTMGQRVSLQYDQHRGLPSSCFGETEYFITAVIPSGASADATPAPVSHP